MIATVEIQHPDHTAEHVGPFPSEHAAKTWLDGHPQLHVVRGGVHHLTDGRLAHIVILRDPSTQLAHHPIR